MMRVQGRDLWGKLKGEGGCQVEKEMATHSSILAWKIPWTEDPGGLQSMGSQKVGHDWTHQQVEKESRVVNFWSGYTSREQLAVRLLEPLKRLLKYFGRLMIRQWWWGVLSRTDWGRCVGNKWWSLGNPRCKSLGREAGDKDDGLVSSLGKQVNINTLNGGRVLERNQFGCGHSELLRNYMLGLCISV